MTSLLPSSTPLLPICRSFSPFPLRLSNPRSTFGFAARLLNLTGSVDVHPFFAPKFVPVQLRGVIAELEVSRRRWLCAQPPTLCFPSPMPVAGDPNGADADVFVDFDFVEWHQIM
eukprot:2614393-Rhodomonas_salina.1